MRGREFITLVGGAAAAWPMAAQAQQGKSMRRIGLLVNLPADNPETQARIGAFLQGLQELGWTIGRNVRIDSQFATDVGSIRRLAAELAAVAPDVVLANANPAVEALQQASRTLPIVFVAVTEPVGSGLVESMARPGGNATGFASAEFGTSAKWLELLKEISPLVTRAAVLQDPTVGGAAQFAAIQSVAGTFGVALTSLAVRDAGEIEPVVTAFVQGRALGRSHLVAISPGRPRIRREVEQLIVRMAEENRDWGYDRIVGALANLGYEVCDQTVGNVLQRHGLPPAPERKRTTTWSAFIRTHLALLAGTDFFTAEVLTLRGLVTYYVLFFIDLESRRVDIAGVAVHPDEPWMQQIARNVTMEGCGALRDRRYLLHDRDTKYTQSFRAIIASGGVEPLVLPARSPNLNAYAERWVRSVKHECLSKVILFGERSLRRALSEYVEHYHAERNHQGKGNILLFPRDKDIRREPRVQCRERLGGLLRYYHQQAA